MGYVKRQMSDSGSYRASYSIWMDWKFKNYKRFKSNLLILLFLKKDKWNDRGIIFIDTILTPFNIKWGCKWFGHDWYITDLTEDITEPVEPKAICLKCHKSESLDKYKSVKREEVINKILKK